ncbi:tetratricopeptide repeat protein [Piscinibacter sakaiensis]|uniref:tetratricopeptide repeat protein n=1 Tax=Piscinibacter sakaiensis TaxID=1547922 RepID=UPI003AAAAB37
MSRRSTAAGAAAGLALGLLAAPAQAQPTAKPSSLALAASGPQVDNSALDAQLFYQLLIGELELRAGAPGTAFQIILDAARKERNEQLFKRAADIALQARAGEQSLIAARAWRKALPKSLDAHRYEIQLLVALGRPIETQDPLKSLIRLTPAAERAALINSLPRFFANASDKKAIPPLLEEVLTEFTEEPASRLAALQALSGAWLIAQEPATALTLARRAQGIDPASEATLLLALQLLPTAPEAESLVTTFFEVQPDNVNMRMLYARVLSGAQRFTDAIAQLELVTRIAPDRASAWLTLGALQLEVRHAREATASLEKFLALSDAGGASLAADNDDTGGNVEQARIQAWLMLAQAAEQRGEYKAAEDWLARVDNPQRALEVQQRRASLLAKQGKIAEARALIQKLPDKDVEATRSKLFAESQLLRDAKMWKEADAVLSKGLERFKDDVDIMYEKSMLAEKLDNMAEMERLLRRVIELKPKHHHAHNALGYSLAERNIRLPEAKQLIEKALELAPGDPFITDSLGWVEYRLGNMSEALRLLRKAYQMRPDTEIGAHLGEVLWVSGQTDEARRIWREARGRDAGNDVLRETLARLRADL